MIYQAEQQYTPQLKINSDQFLLVDLSLLREKEISKYVETRAVQLGCDPQLLTNLIEDTLISTYCLSQKISALVLPLSALTRQFYPVGSNQSGDREAKKSPFSFLKERYDKYLLVGMKIDLERVAEAIQLFEDGTLKKLKMVSFELSEQFLESQLEILKQIISYLVKLNKKMIYHFNLTLRTLQGLKILKQFMVLQGFPIEYICLQTNLLNLIPQLTSSNLQKHWEDIAFTYVQVIKKYVPSALGCLLQFYRDEAGQQLSKGQIDSLYSCLGLINKRTESLQKENKRQHRIGIALPEPILRRLVKQSSTEELSRQKVRSSFDSIDLVALNNAVKGKSCHYYNQT